MKVTSLNLITLIGPSLISVLCYPEVACEVCASNRRSETFLLFVRRHYHQGMNLGHVWFLLEAVYAALASEDELFHPRSIGAVRELLNRQYIHVSTHCWI